MARTEATVPETALRDAERYIEAEEGAAHRLTGASAAGITVLAVIMTLFHLYAAYAIVPTHVLRGIHVGFVLALCFLLYPFARRLRDRIRWWDVVAALSSLVVVGNLLFGGDAFLERAIAPNVWDQICGVVLIVLVLEAARRTSGWVMPAICILFLAYAFAGPHLPPPWTHYGMGIGRIVGHMYMTLEGILGVAIDVSSSLIILFTIYGAFLQYSGAGRFFIDFSFAAMGGKRSGAGRTVVLASFLLGGPSGSGVATTVTLGSVAYPMLARAGYGKDAAGGLLAAGGLGAIISPPVLGAAAFLIAQFLNLSYLDVILMAVMPTLLFYFALFLMVEIDARKFGIPAVEIAGSATLKELIRNYWFHFVSLIAIVVFLLSGFSPVASVFWATITTFVLGFLHVDCTLISRDVLLGRQPLLAGLWNSRLVQALKAGSVGMLGVGATCAAAGIIVGVVTLTGLGLKFSSIVLQYADGATRSVVDLLGVLGVGNTVQLTHDIKLLMTAIMTSLIVWIVGLAVPVTASYIICAVIAAPALIKLGVPDFAAHMFIFYYAVLSEVSPPTALSPFAAAAITGGNPYRTTFHSWKYAMPAFLVPFMFVLDPAGLGLLLMGSLQKLLAASWLDIAGVCLTAAVGIAALAAGVQGWILRETNRIERTLLVLAGLALVYPKSRSDMVGMILIMLSLMSHVWRTRRSHGEA